MPPLLLAVVLAFKLVGERMGPIFNPAGYRGGLFPRRADLFEAI